MNIEDRVDKIEKRVSRGENRSKLIEQAILQMKDLVLSHDNRLEEYWKSFRESREDFNFKLNALIELQLENESGIRELRASTKELKESSTQQRESIRELRESSSLQRESISELRDSTNDLRIASQAHLKRIEKLENK